MWSDQKHARTKNHTGTTRKRLRKRSWNERKAHIDHVCLRQVHGSDQSDFERYTQRVMRRHKSE
jgi:hypothetical protein